MSAIRPPPLPWPTGGRGLIGIWGAWLGFVFGVVFLCSLYYALGFVPVLVCAFGTFLCTSHAFFAFKRNLRPKMVRMIDYWYLTPTAIALLMFAATYNKERDVLINQNVELARKVVEPQFVMYVQRDIAAFQVEACDPLITNVTTDPCARAKDALAMVKSASSVADIKKIEDAISYSSMLKYTVIQDVIRARAGRYEAHRSRLLSARCDGRGYSWRLESVRPTERSASAEADTSGTTI
jgi:branched-subunit amino acid transport protein AzlD